VRIASSGALIVIGRWRRNGARYGYGGGTGREAPGMCVSGGGRDWEGKDEGDGSFLFFAHRRFFLGLDGWRGSKCACFGCSCFPACSAYVSLCLSLSVFDTRAHTGAPGGVELIVLHGHRALPLSFCLSFSLSSLPPSASLSRSLSLSLYRSIALSLSLAVPPSSPLSPLPCSLPLSIPPSLCLFLSLAHVRSDASICLFYMPKP